MAHTTLKRAKGDDGGSRAGNALLDVAAFCSLLAFVAIACSLVGTLLWSDLQTVRLGVAVQGRVVGVGPVVQMPIKIPGGPPISLPVSTYVIEVEGVEDRVALTSMLVADADHLVVVRRVHGRYTDLIRTGRVADTTWFDRWRGHRRGLLGFVVIGLVTAAGVCGQIASIVHTVVTSADRDGRRSERTESSRFVFGPQELLTSLLHTVIASAWLLVLFYAYRTLEELSPPVDWRHGAIVMLVPFLACIPVSTVVAAVHELAMSSDRLRRAIQWVKVVPSVIAALLLFADLITDDAGWYTARGIGEKLSKLLEWLVWL